MSEQLVDAGIELIEGFDPGQMAIAPDCWIIGNVVTRGNPLIEAILDAGAPFVSGPQWLAEHVLRGRHVLAVAGTHGKTTVTSMLASILQHAGLEPGYLVGGVPNDFGRSARLTQSRYFVIEADEYDTAFFDKRSKFVHYLPRTAVINNLEFDHADIFADLGAIETQFHHLVRTLPASARLIVNGADDAIERVLARGCWSQLERFGVREADWTVEARAPYHVRRHGQAVGELALVWPGRHNQLNALAAIAAAAHVGVEPAVALEALARFAGIRRRLESRGVVDGVSVIDDFAHHPTAIAATIEALRSSSPGRRLIAVLEPRSNTMKQGTMKAQLAASLMQADRVFCYSGGIGWDVASVLGPLGAAATTHADLDALADAIVADAQPGDCVLVMSNGAFGGIHGRLLERLAERAKRAA
jgi:UDP-N-acetylmuramate: L-alanyl-gamma-D-glutamyl-meso-diaminopimelate ligase